MTEEIAKKITKKKKIYKIKNKNSIVNNTI